MPCTLSCVEYCIQFCINITNHASLKQLIQMGTIRTNMGELLNRFMETSCLAIKPEETRIHRLVILRFLYSFGSSANVSQCHQILRTEGVDIGSYKATDIEVIRIENIFIHLFCCHDIISSDLIIHRMD
jgi:hypothetical protein